MLYVSQSSDATKNVALVMSDKLWNKAKTKRV